MASTKLKVTADYDTKIVVQELESIKQIIIQLKELGISKRNLNRIIKHIKFEVKKDDALD